MAIKTVRASLLATLLALAALPAAAQRTIAMGQTVSGSLTSSDPVLADDSHYHLYRIAARAGDRLEITLRSPDFDAFLAFGPDAVACEPECAADDDGAGGTDSRLRVTIPATGSYQIRASSLFAGETGAYTLSVESMPPEPRPATRPIAVGQTVSGTLSSAAAVLHDGTYYDVYRFTGRAGQRVEITLRSTDFDAFLYLGTMKGTVWDELAFDDDSGGGLDARITRTLETDGTYYIRANTLSVGETGGYSLSVREVAPTAAGSPRERR